MRLCTSHCIAGRITYSSICIWRCGKYIDLRATLRQLRCPIDTSCFPMAPSFELFRLQVYALAHYERCSHSGRGFILLPLHILEKWVGKKKAECLEIVPPDLEGLCIWDTLQKPLLCDYPISVIALYCNKFSHTHTIGLI